MDKYLLCAYSVIGAESWHCYQLGQASRTQELSCVQGVSLSSISWAPKCETLSGSALVVHTHTQPVHIFPKASSFSLGELALNAFLFHSHAR